MRKNELIKTRLYFIFAVLLLTVVCIVVYTSMRSGSKPDDRSYELAQEPEAETEDEETNLQQVSSTPYPGTSEQSPSSAAGEHVTAQDKPTGVTYRLAVTDGYLQVYVVQTGKLYMETGIAYALLPERVQTQIDEGKYFESEEALLEFLENYSS